MYINKNFIDAENWEQFYIYFYSKKNRTEYFTDSGNGGGINFLAASYYIQSITYIPKTETYLGLSQGRTGSKN